MQTGLVSTIIPVYNRPGMLVEAVQSVLDQSYRPIEVIIVDDGSYDTTPEVAKALSKTQSEVSFLSIVNSGPGPAREAGRQVAQGEFIQYLDSDDLLHNSKFTLQVEGLQQHPECGVAYCRQHYCDMDGNILDDAWMRSAELHETMFPAMLAGRLWGTPAPLYRSLLLDTCGPWLSLKSEEDWEYDCRVASKGVLLHYCPEPLVTIRTHNQDHFGSVSTGETGKIKDRSRAYEAIFEHAITAGIDPTSVEMNSFIRMVFALSRKCGALGLIDEAKALFKIASNASSNSTRSNQYRIYQLGASILGWKTMGKLSMKLDNLRP